MRLDRRLLVAAAVVAALSSTLPRTRAAEPQALRVALDRPGELSAWDERIERLGREGGLTLRRVTADTLIPGREHQRLSQTYRGVRVFGGELVRQTDGARTLSLFGTLYQDIDLDTRPSVSAAAARSIVERLAGVALGPRRQPELWVLPRDGGGYVLAWKLQAFAGGDLMLYFVDAHTGEIAFAYSNLQRQTAAPGLGTGVLGDQKKLSVASQGGTFHATDELRPPEIVSYDLKGNLLRTLRFINNEIGLGASDVAQDSDNSWTDGAVVDAHSYAGWTYDYYFKRFGRRGLDNNNIAIVSIVHPVRREDLARYSASDISLFYLNAAYLGDGLMLYGEGLPAPLTVQGQRWNYLAGGLDVVAHELTHGVTDYSSGLIYFGESGALNEAFSDIMAASVEFFSQPAGSGSLQADYLIGEDVITPGGLRSMQNPIGLGDPDHYSLRYTGPQDNGGVHTNSGIANHAFFLAIEGGRNRISGLTVQGVGAANREQIERVFYRAFTLLMPPSANFATAREATIRAATDLYGASSGVTRAVTEAWTAVGVN